jgi:hypothetical protein
VTASVDHSRIGLFVTRFDHASVTSPASVRSTAHALAWSPVNVPPERVAALMPVCSAARNVSGVP